MSKQERKVHKVTVEKNWYLSKKFWAAVLACVMNLLEALGVSGAREISYPLLAYMLGQGLADLGKNKVTR